MSLVTVKDLDIQGKTVLYCVDYNVPLTEGGAIADTYRIESTYPTLDYLIEQGCKVLLVSHLGRPDGSVVPSLSLRPITQVLADKYKDQEVYFAHKIFSDQLPTLIEKAQAGALILLENIRFFPEEEENDKAFAKKLAALADVYINDAFGTDHRAHASTAGVAKYLPSGAGFLLEKEIVALTALMQSPAHPFVVVMGGAKVSDKIPLIEAFAKEADYILVGGAMVNTFLLAQGQPVGASKVEEDRVEEAKKLLKKYGEKLVLASDFVKDDEESEAFRYLDIGSESMEQFKAILSSAKTIFWNGSLGYAEDPRFAVATHTMASFLAARSEAAVVIAGGDTVEVVTELGLREAYTHVSTGGGAALEFLVGHSLPGIEPLMAKGASK